MNQPTLVPDKFRLEHPAIQVQHEVLFALYDEVSHALERNSVETLMEDVLAGLQNYTKFHFAFEEALMDDSSYQDQRHHKEEHRALERDVMALINRYQTTHDTDIKRSIAKEVQEFLYRWLLNHIASTDRALCSALLGQP